VNTASYVRPLTEVKMNENVHEPFETTYDSEVCFVCVLIKKQTTNKWVHTNHTFDTISYVIFAS